MEELRSIGFGPDVQEAFDASSPEPGSVPGRVTEDHRGVYVVRCEGGELHAVVSGRLQYLAAGPEDLPCVGDWVRVCATPDGPAMIQGVLPRRTALVRKTPDRPTRAQVLATNVDLVLVVTSANRDFNPRRIERTLVVVGESGAKPVVTLSKVDLCEAPDDLVADLERVAPGVLVVAVSSVTGQGIDPIRALVGVGQTAVLIGSSGVGKSTLVNRLLGREVQATRAVREDDDRGRHATSHRQLLCLPAGGVLIDTPGLREIGLYDGGEGVASVFPEFEALAERCRFRDCGHQGEPGCEVAAALEDGRLDAGRVASLHKLEREAAAVRARRDAQGRHERRKQQKAFAKKIRGLSDKRRPDRDPQR